MTTGSANERAEPATYLEWNDTLASAVFRPEMAGREVLLSVTNDMIREIGGGNFEVPDFVATVVQGPPWALSTLGLCQNALRAFEGWRSRGRRFPPYIGYLALFVLAVGVKGDFREYAYYGRLRTLLGWPDVHAGPLPSFYEMYRLWEDLEIWSQQDEGGDLGLFSVRFAGEWMHVGLPKAQAALTEVERKGLLGIFAAAAFDPTAPPSDRELARALKNYGGQVLRSRTLELLGNRSRDAELSSLLLDAVRTELENWDGETTLETDFAGQYAVSAIARVCLRIDPVAKTCRSTLRVRAKADFPEDGLVLATAPDGIELTCQASELPGWSSLLKDKETTSEAVASTFDWSETHVFADSRAGWRVRLAASRVRIFVEGLSMGLPGLVEVHGIERMIPFYLAASPQTVRPLEAWRDSGQVDLQAMNVNGLPDGWTLFKSAGTNSDEAIRNALPELALPTTIRLKLTEGIRVDRGNTYFSFAPPVVVVEGGRGDEQVLCGDRHLQPVATCSNTFELPTGLPAGTRNVVQVSRDGELLRRQSFFLADDIDWNLLTPMFACDSFGNVHEGEPENDEVAGATGGSNKMPSFPIRPRVTSYRRRFLVGRRPGEIKRFFRHPPPVSWQPVWMIQLRRRGVAEYCGLDVANSYPLAEVGATRKERVLWKKILWYRRKRIQPPRDERLRKLWDEFADAAAHLEIR